jgi:hypothetical protein
MPPRLPDDEENKVMEFTPAEKYNLLRFLEGYRFSPKQLEIIEQCIETILPSKLENYKKSIGERVGNLEEALSNKLHSIELKMKDESSARDKEDEKFRQKFSNGQWVIGTLIALAGLYVGFFK